MTAHVELKENPDHLSSLLQSPAVRRFISFFTDHTFLLTALNHLHFHRGNKRSIVELFQLVQNKLILYGGTNTTAVVATMEEADQAFRKLHPKQKPKQIVALILEGVVRQYLDRRCPNVQRDVHVYINGEQVKPSGPNIDFGLIEQNDENRLELYECKVNVRDLFERGKNKLRLLCAVAQHKELRTWSVVCAIPTLRAKRNVETVRQDCKVPEEITIVSLGELHRLEGSPPPY